MADDAFTEANKLRTQVVAIDRARAILTTREDAERESLEREAKTKIQEQQFEIREAQEERAASTFEIQQQILMEELRAARGQLDKQETFDAFDRYNADGNPRHLNNLFKNKRIQQAEAAGGSPIVSFDKIDVANDQTLIQRSDLDPDIFAEEEAIKQFVKVTHADGTKDILDLHKIYASTGYLEQLEDEKLTKLERKVKIKKAEADIVEALRGGGVKLNLTQEANVARFISRLTPEQLEKFKSGAKIAGEIFPEKEKVPTLTAAQKELKAAEISRQEVFDLAGGEEEFFGTNPKDLPNRREIAAKIIEIERFTRTRLSSTERKKNAELNKLLSLGDLAATELSKESTGLIDNTLRNVEKFITDNVKGAKGRSAYAAYRNVIRHALFGSVLTKGEVKSFNEAFGALGQQLGPVLQQLEVSLFQIQTDFDSLANSQDELVSHFRLGIPKGRIADVISALQERIDAISEFENSGRKLVLAGPAQRVKPKEISEFKFSTGE